MSYEKICEYQKMLDYAIQRKERLQRIMVRSTGAYKEGFQSYIDKWAAEETKMRSELARFTVIERDPTAKVIGAPGLNIGLGVCITRGRKFLISRRLEACRIGVNCLAMPGGSFDHAESIVDCMVRETREETGLEVEPVFDSAGDSPVFHVQENDREGMRIITLYTHARPVDPNAEPVNSEPHKHTPWEWVTLDDLGSANSDQSWLPLLAFYRNYERLFIEGR